MSADTTVAEAKPACRNSRGSRNGSRTRRPRTTVAMPATTATTASTAATTAGSGPPDSGSARLPSRVRASETADQEGREQDRAHDVEPAGAPGRLPVAAGGPGHDEGDDRDRDVDVEDPAPGGRQQAAGHRARVDAQLRQRRGRVDRAQDRGAQERPGGHAQERERRDEAQGPRTPGAGKQVRRGRGRHRDHGPAADRLDEPRSDQQLERGRHPGQQAAHGEHDEGRQEQPPRAPQVGHPPGQRHRDDRHEEVAVDDPRRLAETGPARDVGHDRGQGDGRDHELEAGEEDAGAEDGEQQVRVASRERVHRGRV